MRQVTRHGLALFLLLFLPVHAFAQTPMASLNAAGIPSAGVAKLEAAPNNPWLPSAQVGFKLIDSGQLADAVLVSAQLLYEIPFVNSQFHLPVMGNIGGLTADVTGDKPAADSLAAKTAALLGGTEGLNLALDPYYVVQSGTNLQGTLFGRVGIKANDFADSDKTQHLLVQGRFGIGYEQAIGSTSQGLRPLTVSVLGGINTFSKDSYRRAFGESRDHLAVGELTMMVPISRSGTGILVEGVVADRHAPALRVSFLISKPSSSETTTAPVEVPRKGPAK